MYKRHSCEVIVLSSRGQYVPCIARPSDTPPKFTFYIFLLLSLSALFAAFIASFAIFSFLSLILSFSTSLSWLILMYCIVSGDVNCQFGSAFLTLFSILFVCGVA